MYFKIMSCLILWFFTSISTKCRVMIHGSLQLMMISYIFWYAIPQSKKYIKRYNHDIDRLHLLFQVGGWALPQRDLIVRPHDFFSSNQCLKQTWKFGPSRVDSTKIYGPIIYFLPSPKESNDLYKATVKCDEVITRMPNNRYRLTISHGLW